LKYVCLTFGEVDTSNRHSVPPNFPVIILNFILKLDFSAGLQESQLITEGPLFLWGFFTLDFSFLGCQVGFQGLKGF